jgi:hypothetical protein
MKKRLFVPSKTETVLLCASAALFFVGVVQAYGGDPPAFICAGMTQQGCTPQTCPYAPGTCAGSFYLFAERDNFTYRVCNGAEGTCADWSESLKICEERFYEEVDCSTKECSIITTLSACPP